MLAIPEGGLLEDREFVEQVRQVKTCIAFDLVDAVVVSPLHVQSADGV